MVHVANPALCAKPGRLAPVNQDESRVVFWGQTDLETTGSARKASPRTSVMCHLAGAARYPAQLARAPVRNILPSFDSL